MARRHLMEFDDAFGDSSLGDMLGAVVTPEQLKGLLLGAFVGGGGILGVGYLVKQLPAAVSDTWRSVITTVGGLVLGRLVWNLDDDAGRGVASGVGGFGIAKLLEALTSGSISVGLSAYDKSYGWAMGQPGTRYMNWGVGRTRVEPQQAGTPRLGAQVGQFGRTRVEERGAGQFKLGSAFGQDVSVGTWLT